eukprot:SAG11_NODE_3796_length_2220_cov_41.000471_4_plen_165_part_00
MTMKANVSFQVELPDRYTVDTDHGEIRSYLRQMFNARDYGEIHSIEIVEPEEPAEPEEEETKQSYYVEFYGFSGGISVDAVSEQDAIDKVADPRHGSTIDIDIAEPITVTMRGGTGKLTFLGDQNLTTDEVETILDESDVRVELVGEAEEPAAEPEEPSAEPED